MPCHVPATSVSSRRRLPSLRLSPPRIVAALDLQNPSERAAHDLLRRFTTGRWPQRPGLGVRRVGAQMLSASAWLRCPVDTQFALAEVSLTQPLVRWQLLPTARAARAALSG